MRGGELKWMEKADTDKTVCLMLYIFLWWNNWMRAVKFWCFSYGVSGCISQFVGATLKKKNEDVVQSNWKYRIFKRLSTGVNTYTHTHTYLNLLPFLCYPTYWELYVLISPILFLYFLFMHITDPHSIAKKKPC